MNTQRFFLTEKIFRQAVKKFHTNRYLAIAVCLIFLLFYNYISNRCAPYNFYNSYVDFKTNYSYQTILKPQNVCTKPLFAMFLITSRPGSVALRDAIRKTWISRLNAYNSKAFFVIGSPDNANDQKLIESEHLRNSDLIQEHFVDSYFNLSIKSVVGLQWAVKTCQNRTKYILKVDDDTYINVKKMINLLKNNRNPDMLLGSISVASHPVRSEFDKSYCPQKFYEADVYPAFVSGFCYVMTFEIAAVLYRQVVRLPFLHLEDVLVTGIAAREANISLIHNDQFHRYKTSLEVLLEGKFIAAHYINKESMLTLFNNNI